VWHVQVALDDIVPVLTSRQEQRPDAVVHDFVGGVGIVYAVAPAPDHSLGWQDLRRLGLDERSLHSLAFGNLHAMLGTVSLHGSPPTLMASFHGLESSLLLADAFWDDLAPDLPGAPVVAVPARDVLVITASGAPAGVAKARRSAERVFFAGSPNLLLPDLLERHGNRWQLLEAGPPADVPEPERTWDEEYEEPQPEPRAQSPIEPQFEAQYEPYVGTHGVSSVPDAGRWSTPEDRTIAPRQERPYYT
jgi:hypothetical protein